MRRINRIILIFSIIVASSSSADTRGRLIGVEAHNLAKGTQEKTFSISALTRRYLGFQDDAENYTLFAANVGFALSKSQSIMLEQSVIAFDVINPGYNEVEPADTIVGFIQELPTSWH